MKCSHDPSQTLKALITLAALGMAIWGVQAQGLFGIHSRDLCRCVSPAPVTDTVAVLLAGPTLSLAKTDPALPGGGQQPPGRGAASGEKGVGR